MTDPDPTSELIDLSAIEAAREALRGVVKVTSCSESLKLSEATGCRVFCKRDYLQATGSFKERGAAYALLRLPEKQRNRGVIAASAGNHALALTYHGRRLGVPVTVVMPTHSPLIKVSTCRKMGATVELFGDGFSAARQHADALAIERGLSYVHGFDDPDVIAGQGTMGLEVLEQAPDVDAVVVPVGGGGLLAGVATAIKAKRPEVEIIGVEPAKMAGFAASAEAGKCVEVEAQPTLADGLAVGLIGSRAFAVAAGKFDRLIQVSEDDISLAILRLLELEKAVVEGAGASSLAGLLSGQLDDLKGKNVVLLLCGGNIDPLTLHRVIGYGMVRDGRLHAFNVQISDRPGGLAKLSTVLAEAGASVRDIRHERSFAGADVSQVQVHIVLETHDDAHFDRVREQLTARGFGVTPA